MSSEKTFQMGIFTSPSILLSWRNWGACSSALPIKPCRSFWNSRAQASLQHLLAFSTLVQAAATFSSFSCIFLAYLDSPHSANRAKQGSNVSKLFIGALGLGVYGGTRLWLLEMFMHLKRKAPGYMSQRLCDLLQRLYRHVAQAVWSRNW